MDGSQLSNTTKEFIERILASGEKWLIEDLERMFKEAVDEPDFLQEFRFYLTRLDVKIKTLRDEFAKIYSE